MIMTEYVLGEKSLKELNGVHPKLVEVVKQAISLSPVDFAVHDGLRTIQEQREYVKNGVSRTMNSMHMKQNDGFGHAVDLVPYINGKLRWEWEPIYQIANVVDFVSTRLGVNLIWGGVWDLNMTQYGGDLDKIKGAVKDYVSRRKKAGKSAFIDGPHFQLA